MKSLKFTPKIQKHPNYTEWLREIKMECAEKETKKQSVGKRVSGWDKEKIQTEDGTEIEATAPVIIRRPY